MNYFSGCTIFFKLISLIIIISITFPNTSIAAKEQDGDNTHISELLSREDMSKLAGYGEEKLSNVIITGTLVCQSCFHAHRHVRTWPISGALVSMNCNKKGKPAQRNVAKAVTDEFGEFQIDVPSHLHGIPNLDRTCWLNVHRIPKTLKCRPTFASKKTTLTLASARNGNRLYTAGAIKLLHSKSRPLHLCMNKGSTNAI